MSQEIYFRVELSFQDVQVSHGKFFYVHIALFEQKLNRLESEFVLDSNCKTNKLKLER